MQTLTEKILLLDPPGGLFDRTVVSNLFPDSSPGARALLVHRACKAGEVQRLKPGLFVLGAPYRRSEPHPFVIAGALHAPSHVSLESALAYHGLISDAVYLDKRIDWRRDGLRYLTESLRIEEDDLRLLSFDAFEEITESIRSRRVRAYLEGLREAVSHAG